MTKEQRRAQTATFPKCNCGNVLGTDRVHRGLTLCSRCEQNYREPSELERLRRRVEALEIRLAMLEDPK